MTRGTDTVLIENGWWHHKTDGLFECENNGLSLCHQFARFIACNAKVIEFVVAKSWGVLILTHPLESGQSFDEPETFNVRYSSQHLRTDCTGEHNTVAEILVGIQFLETFERPPAEQCTQFVSGEYFPLSGAGQKIKIENPIVTHHFVHTLTLCDALRKLIDPHLDHLPKSHRCPSIQPISLTAPNSMHLPLDSGI